MNRKNKYITLREFKTKNEEGFSIRNIINSGISKHLLQFFSNFCQGKINLTKEQFTKEYKHGLSLEEIAEKYLITRDNITFLRQLYGIKRKGATFIHRKKTEEIITDRQKEIIYGCLMGDGKRINGLYNNGIGIVQGSSQKEYAEWKYIELENLTNKKGISVCINYDKRYNKEYTSYRFHTKPNSDIEPIINQFYFSGIKEISNEILQNLTPLSIAVWFMDDGYSDKNTYGISNFIFCTDSFSKESCENISSWFKDRWGIKTIIRKRKLKDRIGYRIVIKSVSVDDFIILIDPYIIPSMKYKITE